MRTETGATITQKADRFSVDESSSANKSTSATSIEYDWETPVSGKTYKSASGNTIEYDLQDGDDPFQVGAVVEHAKFGPGKIISRTGLGMDTKVVVFFKSRGQKKLMLKAAPLKVIG